MRSTLYMVMGTLALAAAGCGNEEEPETPCPADASAGAALSCPCGDGGEDGEQICQADGKLSDCDCSDAFGGSGGGGGRAGRGGAGAGASGRGGSTAEDDDGGTPPTESDAGGAMTPQPDAGPMTPTAPLPADGNQLAVCQNGRDCNMNLDCYAVGPGRGFCSQVCEGDEECMALPGAAYVCATSGICNIPCQDEADTQSCPGGMVCLDLNEGGGDNGGGQGNEPAFRCKYPPQEPEEPEGQPAFGPCNGQSDCQDGLDCVDDLMGNDTGYCSVPCNEPAACAELMPSSGTIAPSCEPNSPTMGTCALDCSAAPAGCPDGMMCLMTNFYSRCGYQE